LKSVISWLKRGVVLGHVVYAKRLEVDKVKVDIIQYFPYSQNVREVGSFLGHAGFYRRFIKDFFKIASPLCYLLVKDACFDFNENCIKAFDKLKMKMNTTPRVQPLN